MMSRMAEINMRISSSTAATGSATRRRISQPGVSPYLTTRLSSNGIASYLSARSSGRLPSVAGADSLFDFVGVAVGIGYYLLLIGIVPRAQAIGLSDFF